MQLVQITKKPTTKQCPACLEHVDASLFIGQYCCDCDSELCKVCDEFDCSGEHCTVCGQEEHGCECCPTCNAAPYETCNCD